MEILIIAIVAILLILSINQPSYGYNRYNRYNRYNPPPVVIQTQPDYAYRRDENGSSFIATILFIAMMMFLLYYFGNDATNKNREHTQQNTYTQVNKE